MTSEKPMTPEDFAARMAKIAADDDIEGSHVAGDVLMLKLLRSLGYGEGCDIFGRMDRWYA